MELQEAKDKFIHTWGTLATQWGINRTMAQIHALLLLSPKALNADEIVRGLLAARCGRFKLGFDLRLQTGGAARLKEINFQLAFLGHGELPGHQRWHHQPFEVG